MTFRFLLMARRAELAPHNNMNQGQEYAEYANHTRRVANHG